MMGGDHTARLVLADLLSDQGDQELADFALRTRTTREGDLDLAIRVLPCPEVVELGCTFVEHIMTGKGTTHRHAWLLAKLALVRRLLRREASADQFAAAHRGLADYQSQGTPWRDERHLDGAARALAVAVQNAFKLARQLSRETAESADAAGLAVASVARSLRRHLRDWRRVGEVRKELESQIKGTRRLLEELTVVCQQFPRRVERDQDLCCAKCSSDA